MRNPTSSATPEALRQAQHRLAQATRRYDAACQTHKAGCLALFARLTAEGLLHLPDALRSGPCTRATAEAYAASDATWITVQSLQAELDDAVAALFVLRLGPGSDPMAAAAP